MIINQNTKKILILASNSANNSTNNLISCFHLNFLSKNAESLDGAYVHLSYLDGLKLLKGGFGK